MGGMNIDLSEKVALVTGGSRGLGKAIALAMAEKGAKVVICGRKQENLDQAVDEFRKEGIEVMARSANIGKSDQLVCYTRCVHHQTGQQKQGNRQKHEAVQPRKCSLYQQPGVQPFIEDNNQQGRQTDGKCDGNGKADKYAQTDQQYPCLNHDIFLLFIRRGF